MSAARARVVLGNALVLAALVLIAALLLGLQHGRDWWSAPPRHSQWYTALASVLAYAAGCSALWWRGRRTRGSASLPSGSDGIVVAWASQTGFAEQLAHRSANALRAAGHTVHLCPLEHLDTATLERSGQLLVIASTTGEGDPPDHALGFLSGVMTTPVALPQLRYGVLALGDRRYHHYCGFGRQLDGWLRTQGATALFDTVEVDNADPAALRHWQQLLAQLGGSAIAEADWSPPDYQPWRLQRRVHCNPGSPGLPVFRLWFEPTHGELPDWQAGDIAEIGPCHGAHTVQQWLAQHGIDGDALVDGQPLHALLARRQLPDQPPVGTPATWLPQLPVLPHREYSIASLPADGNVQLLLRRQLRADGRPGLASGWLCDDCPPGGQVQLRLRSNRNFHPPATDVPLVLIGNGTGIASLRAHLRARLDAGATRNWLLFGERSGAADFHFGEEITRWHAQGALQRLDLVFSRDGGQFHYVQDALAAASTELRRWLDDGATVLVCGSLQGMAPGVDAVIVQAIGREQRDALVAAGRYRRDVY